MVRSAETVAAGRRGRRPLQGGCGDVGFVVIRRRAGVDPRPYEGRQNAVGAAVDKGKGRRGRRPLRRGGNGTCAA